MTATTALVPTLTGPLREVVLPVRDTGRRRRLPGESWLLALVDVIGEGPRWIAEERLGITDADAITDDVRPVQDARCRGYRAPRRVRVPGVRL